MSTENPLIASTKQRLEHLRSMPETPQRRREILSLIRVLETIPLQAATATKVKTATRRKTIMDEYDNEPEHEAPKRIRTIKRPDGSVNIVQAQTAATPEETAEEQRRKKQKLQDIRSMMGSSFRGMS